MYKAVDIAKYIINYSNEIRRPITNTRLQLILYFTQGFFYVDNDESFLDEDFKAFLSNPAIRDVFIEFSNFGPFLIKSKKYDNYGKIEDGDKIFLKSVVETLTKVKITFLLDLATCEDSPWDTAIKNSNNNTISKEKMKKYFRQIKGAKPPRV